MKGLLYSCKNAGREGCHPYIIKYRNINKFKKKVDLNETMPMWIPKTELKKLDEICKKCESRFFGIEEKECPVCGKSDFKEIKGFEYYDGDIKIREDSFLICNHCETFSRFINLL